MGRPRRQQRPIAGGGRRKAVAAVVLVTLVAVGLAFGLAVGLSRGSPSGHKTAAIVDQLSLTQPGPEFVASATDLLERAGYVVDYYPGEQVTVEFYRNLPTLRHDLLILRVHSGIVTEVEKETGEETKAEYVSLFTAEPFDETRHTDELMEGRLGASFYSRGGPWYFGIAPEFIQYSMRGRFEKALVIMMGCDGLRSDETARAFLARGAEAFISWSKPISAGHTDAATQRLLEHLLVERLAVPEAVAHTAAELGPDPLYGGELRFVER